MRAINTKRVGKSLLSEPWSAITVGKTAQKSTLKCTKIALHFGKDTADRFVGCFVYNKVQKYLHQINK